MTPTPNDAPDRPPETTDPAPAAVSHGRHYRRRASDPRAPERPPASLRDVAAVMNELSRTGRILLAAFGVLVPVGAVAGTHELLDGVPASFGERLTTVERTSRESGKLLGGLARKECMHATDLEVVYLQLPCDSLMVGIGGWRAVRDQLQKADTQRRTLGILEPKGTP